MGAVLLPILTAVLTTRGSGHSSGETPSDIIKHMVTLTTTSVATVDRPVLARVLHRILLVVNEVPKYVVNTSIRLWQVDA